MSCAGCLLSEREREEQISIMSAKAKEHADKDKKLFVLYYLSDKQVAFMDADAARASGVTPIKYISWL
jgi:hypothetical protein